MMPLLTMALLEMALLAMALLAMPDRYRSNRKTILVHGRPLWQGRAEA
jgi:hypothetical protein